MGKKAVVRRHNIGRKSSYPQFTGGECSCGGTYILRSGKYGLFYGCSNYPVCCHCRKIGEETESKDAQDEYTTGNEYFSSMIARNLAALYLHKYCQDTGIQEQECLYMLGEALECPDLMDEAQSLQELSSWKIEEETIHKVLEWASASVCYFSWNIIEKGLCV